MEAKRDSSYPQSQVARKKVNLWPVEKTQAFIRGKITAYQDAKQTLPECTKENRWARPDVWAVMKEGRKSAVRLYDNEGSARSHAASDKAFSVTYRPGESIRCEYYCLVSKFCTQYHKLKLSLEVVNGGASE